MRKICLFFLLIILSSPFLFAQTGHKELVGELALSDILLQPRFYAEEAGQQKFELDRSYFFFSWKINRELSTHFGIGQFELMNINERLPTNLSISGEYDQLRFFEAYAEWDSGYGNIRAGIIPLFLGWEATRRESEWYFPRTLFYENHEFGLRDMGASYYVDSAGFYTEFALHNGENGKDVDGKMWHTARVGWKNDRGVDVALSASNGKYEKSKLDSLETFSYFNSYLSFEFQGLLVLAEGFYAKQETKESTGNTEVKFWDYHLDVSHPITSHMNGVFRYEIYEPDNSVEGDVEKRIIAGVSFFNELKTSNLYIWGLINKEESNDINNNEIQIVWKVRSLSLF
jgi:hypothetical protein